MFQATCVGRLARDPEEKNVGNTTVVNFSIAVNQPPKRDGTEIDPIWLSVAAWGEKGDYCMDKLKQGSICVVSGPVKEDSWQDKKSGEKKRKLVIKAETIGGLDYLFKLKEAQYQDPNANMANGMGGQPMRGQGGGYERQSAQQTQQNFQQQGEQFTGFEGGNFQNEEIPF